MAAESFDLVVIGSGTAAMGVARRVRAAGRSVAMIDCRPFGGTCVLRGCDPKKVLWGAAAALDEVRRRQGKGLAGEARLQWDELMQFKRSFTDPVPARREQSLRDKGIAIFHGAARFTGPDTVAVDAQALRGRHILIASGAQPAPLSMDGSEHLIDNEAFLDLEQLPRRMVMVGGGYIATEFSHIAARAGAQVTVVQHGARMLKGFDADLVGWLMQGFAAAGIEVRLNARVDAVEQTGDGFRVRVSRDDAGSQTIECDQVVHAAGRVPAIEALDLGAGQVASDKGRLRLNEFLQSTSNPAVYAAGDAAQKGPPLTPVSSHDAQVVASNILQGNQRRPDYRAVPSVAFSIPPIARVGLDEAQAREQGLQFQLNAAHAPDWFSARQAAQPVHGYKVLVEKGSGRILGAHLVGPYAAETINTFALAIRHGLTAQDLKDTMSAYPSGISDVGYMV